MRNAVGIAGAPDELLELEELPVSGDPLELDELLELDDDEELLDELLELVSSTGGSSLLPPHAYSALADISNPASFVARANPGRWWFIGICLFPIWPYNLNYWFRVW